MIVIKESGRPNPILKHELIDRIATMDNHLLFEIRLMFDFIHQLFIDLDFRDNYFRLKCFSTHYGMIID